MDASVSASADELILIPVREAVLFPGVVLPLAVSRPATVAGLQEAAREGRHVAVVLQRDPAADAPDLAGLYPMGTEARLLRYVTGRDGTHNAIVQGINRVRLLGEAQTAPFGVVRV